MAKTTPGSDQPSDSMKKQSNLTMAAIVAKAEADPVARPDPNAAPGRFNRLHQLFDQKGRRLERSKKEITPQRARALVASGAELAFESCGCGGWTGANLHGLTHTTER